MLKVTYVFCLYTKSKTVPLIIGRCGRSNTWMIPLDASIPSTVIGTPSMNVVSIPSG